MKVVFLDIDGVLNNSRTKEKHPRGFIGIDRANLINFKYFAEMTNVKIVLSSTWRFFHYEYVDDVMKSIGLSLHDKTDDLPDFGRGAEIKSWVDSKNLQKSDFIVLDDQVSSLGPVLDRVVQTNFYEGGLTKKLMRAAIKLIGIDKERQIVLP